MNTTTLSFNETTTPDFGGFRFYVEAGEAFELNAFCEAYGLNAHDVDQQSVKSTQDAASRLCPGQWLEVTFDRN